MTLKEAIETLDRRAKWLDKNPQANPYSRAERSALDKALAVLREKHELDHRRRAWWGLR